MPTRPNTNRNLPTDAAKIMAAAKTEIGGDYAANVPDVYSVGDTMPNGATATIADCLQSLRAAGDTITGYQPYANSFLNALVNRIALVIINSKMYSNPWQRFKRGFLEYGETVEEIFANICKPHTFNPETAEKEVFKREIPDVRAAFHTMNYKKFYKSTISNEELRQAFLSFSGLSDLISKIIESMYTSANYDEFISMKYVVAYNALHGGFYAINTPAATADNANTIVTNLKAMSNKLEYMNTLYNPAGVTTHTPKNSQYFIMTADFNAIMDVEVLARAFNIDKVELMGHTVTVDTFSFNATEIKRLNELFGADLDADVFDEDALTKLAAIPCVVIDANWFMIFDVFQNMTEQYNGEGLYFNYWLHTWKTFSSSPFVNAVLYTTETPSITSVTVNPASHTMKKGTSYRFTAEVVAEGFAPGAVTWSITEENTTSTISPDGILKVAADEPNSTLNVVATSTFDDTKTGKATVTLS